MMASMDIKIDLKDKELTLTMGLFTSVVYIKGINIPLEVGREVTKFLRGIYTLDVNHRSK